MNMKKIIIAIAIVAIFSASLLTVVSLSDESDAADTVDIDGIRYTLTSRGGDDKNIAEGKVINHSGRLPSLPESVTIPEFVEFGGEKYRVTAIGSFISAQGLKTLVIEPNSALTMPAKAFQGSSVVSVTVGEGVVLPSGVFSRCVNLKTAVLPNSITSISESLFENCSKLESVTVSDQLKSIGASSFKGCKNLVSINLPDTLETIEKDAFNGCSSLTDINIGPHVKSIGSGAFKSTNLTSFRISAELTEIEIGENCFLDDLDSIVIAKDNPVYTIENGIVYSKDKTVLLYYPRSASTADGTLTVSVDIGPYAFYKAPLNKVILADGVKTVGDHAFCKSLLTSIQMSDSVTTLGSGVFYMCDNLTSVVFSKGLTEIPENAFYQCTELSEITLPSSMKTVGDHAFYWCKGLKSVTLEGNAEVIGDYAFRDCDALSSINLPDSITTIGNAAFLNDYNVVITKLPSSLTKIGTEAFQECTKLKIDSIPSEVTEIGDHAFYHTSIESIKLGEDKQIKVTMNQLPLNARKTENKHVLYVFGGPALKSVYLNNVTTEFLGYGSFVEVSSNLESYTLGPEFKLWAWDDESGLGIDKESKTAYLLRPGVTKLVIPESVDRLYGSMFQNSEITEVSFTGSNDRTIALETGAATNDSVAGMFYKCNQLVKVSLPGVTFGGSQHTFNGCSSLSEIEIWNADSIPAYSIYDVTLSKFVLHSCKDIKCLPNSYYIQLPDDLSSFSNTVKRLTLKLADGSSATASKMAGKTFVSTGPYNNLREVTENDAVITLVMDAKTTYYVVEKGTIADLTKCNTAGYSIDKWYTDAEKTVEYDKSAITGPCTFYASVKSAPVGSVLYKITFEGEETVCIKWGSSYLVSGDRLTASSLSVCGIGKAGYYTSIYANGELIADNIGVATKQYTLNSDTVFMIKYEKRAPVQVKFDTVGGSTVSSINGTAGEPMDRPENPVKENYIFVKWLPEIGDVFPSVLKNTCTLTAIWAPVQVDIIFDGCGGVAPDALVRSYNSMIGDLPVSTREGYTFDGWFTEAEGGSEITYETVVKTSENIGVFAHWKVNSYTLSFDTVGGSMVQSITQDYGTSVTAPESPSKEGYAFIGWDIEVPKTVPAQNMVFKALWAKVAVTDDVGNATVDIDGSGSVSVPASAEKLIVNLGSGYSIAVGDAVSISGKVMTAGVSEVANPSQTAGTAYELVFTSGDTQYTGKMEITLPYVPADGKEPAVYYWDGSNVVRMDVTGHTDSTVTFTTEHNSVYIVGQVDSEDEDSITAYVVVAFVLIVLIALCAAFIYKNKRKA